MQGFGGSSSFTYTMDKSTVKFLISRASVPQKTILLKTLNTVQARTVSEIIVNVLYGVLPISRHYKRLLKRFKDLWVKLASCSDNTRAILIGKNIKPVILILDASAKYLSKIV